MSDDNVIKIAEKESTETVVEDTPPIVKRGRGRPKGTTNKPKAAALADIETGLTNLFTMAGTGVSMINQYDGAVIIMQGSRCAKSLTDLSATNSEVRRVVSKMLQTSVWMSVASAFVPMMLAIGANHNVAPRMFLMDIEGVKPTLYDEPSDNGDGIIVPDLGLFNQS